MADKYADLRRLLDVRRAELQEGILESSARQRMTLESAQSLGLDIPLVVEVRKPGAKTADPPIYIEPLLTRTTILRILEELSAECLKNEEDGRVLYVLGIARIRLLAKMSGV